MLVQERRQQVLDLVSQKAFVTLADLAAAIQVSESTLRRDLDYWNRKGLLKHWRNKKRLKQTRVRPQNQDQYEKPHKTPARSRFRRHSGGGRSRG